MSRLTERARALAVAGGVAGAVALAGPAAANVIVNVPWAGTVPVFSSTDTGITRTTSANVANVVRFVGITGEARFFAAEGGTGFVFATVGGIERTLLAASPGVSQQQLLSTALPQNMSGTLTQIRLAFAPGPFTQNPADVFFNLGLAGTRSPTIFQFEVADGSSIPEPASVLTLLFGMAGLEMARRRRQAADRALPVSRLT